MEIKLENLEKARSKVQQIIENIENVIIGKKSAVELAVVTLICQGHALIEDVPGVGKTMLARSLSKSIGCDFSRIQFTPDLLPSDITGVSIYNQQTGEFQYKPGPVVSQLVLADEINRATPKTQSALLQAMQEYQVTAGGNTYHLNKPFFVLATQNPIEQEGTYPLPEAQLDRFMFNIYIDYPSQPDERQIVMNTTSAHEPTLNSVTNSDEITRIQQVVRKVPVAESVVDFAVAITRLSRPSDPEAPDFIKNWVNWGAGTRASQYMILGAKARAVMHGRYHVTYDDVKSIAKPVLRHRILTNFNAEADEITSLEIIDKLLELNLEDH